ncbi:MAG: NUDIX domain-containing protein [Phycisphaerales bacterium]|nr:NUDIX domain-containing protein [Phycisphaerales bacterium]
MMRIIAPIVDVYVFRRAPDGPKFLLLLRAAGRRIGSTWQVVHGTIEQTETAVAAALREMREETGLTPTRFWQLEGVNPFFVAAEDAIYMCPGFAAEVASDATVTLCDEHTDFRWLPTDEALGELMWPGQRRAVREIVEEIIGEGRGEPFLRLPIE